MFTLPLRHPGHPLDPAELRMRAHELIQMGGGPGDRYTGELLLAAAAEIDQRRAPSVHSDDPPTEMHHDRP